MEGVFMDQFNQFRIAHLGPFVLGDTAWQLFGATYFWDWSIFKE